MAKVKLYNPDDKDSFYMQFGNLLARKRQNMEILESIVEKWVNIKRK